MKIKETIVVEGYHDKQALLKIVEANVLVTQGSYLSEKMLKVIEEAHKENGVIVFTDPDTPGKKIRQMIQDRIPDVKHAHLMQKDARDKHKVGVEHASQDVLIKALENVMTISTEHSDLTLNDLIDLGLSSHPESQALRKCWELTTMVLVPQVVDAVKLPV
ncbi:MAG: ribonuclease M5, partial [Erysipelotrichaceae bacterium]